MLAPLDIKLDIQENTVKVYSDEVRAVKFGPFGRKPVFEKAGAGRS